MAPKPKKTPTFKCLSASLCDAFNNVWICEISGSRGGEYEVYRVFWDVLPEPASCRNRDVHPASSPRNVQHETLSRYARISELEIARAWA
jgi:hypothetical protein